MDHALQRRLQDWLRDRVDAVGFAPVDRWSAAPERHHPSAICRDAATVIVFGRAMPRGVLASPEYNLYLLHRSYHSIYPALDDIALRLSNRLEAEGFFAVPIPSYAPLVFHGAEPWGILSLKHAAVSAGLAALGRSGLAYHPRFGALLRLAAVVTNAQLSGDPVLEAEPCPPKCQACHQACPAGAFAEGGFQKMKCLAHTIRHGIYPLALKGEEGLKNLEMIINTAGYNYWLKCDECLKVCPLHRRPRGPAPAAEAAD
ncbi:MAG: hypothetical protein A2V67_12385 [Deltaproteobacteria bacterium RBG_13_61_14]|nr:MAG: hypothetical protein A2V67_12385 [Deltaproteobacteria bacterium RBG_13_61_14]